MVSARDEGGRLGWPATKALAADNEGGRAGVSQYAPVGRVLPYGHSGRTARRSAEQQRAEHQCGSHMGDVQQPSRMSRWSEEVPSHVQDEEEEASKRQRVERPLPCAEGGGEAGPSADDSDSACEAQEEGEEEELEDEEVGEEEEEGDEEYSAGEEEEEDTGEESERDSDNEGGSDDCDNEPPVRLIRK